MTRLGLSTPTKGGHRANGGVWLLFASMVAVSSMAAVSCGGTGGDAESPEAATGEPGSEWTGAGADDVGPSGPDCSDGTCFSCGEGFCPTGAYCAASAPNGPACAWVTECAGNPGCDCLRDVLGADCSCETSGGGPTVSCR